MSKNELTAKVRELKELQQMADELQAEITAIQDSIKSEMSSQNVDEIVVDVFKIRWKEVKSNRFDTTAFKSTHKALYDQYTKEIITKRFTVA